MPIQAYGGFKKMTGFCKTRVPTEVAEAMEARKDDTDAVKAYGIEYATQMCQQILASEEGVNGLHFYTLNLEKTVFAILDKLGLKKQIDSEAPTTESENTLQGTHIN